MAAGGGNTLDDGPQLWAQAELCYALILRAKFGGCHEVQKYRVYRNSHLVIETSQEVSDVPYSDYFCVEGLWNVERDKDESKECCILRVESDSVAAVPQNDEMNLAREVKNGESSEVSQEQSNPTNKLVTSSAFDATTHNVGTHSQGNTIDTSSVPLLKELTTKFRSSLKSQSNLSLLLVAIVALIFFMQQFSILVLLARPQHVHMNTPVDLTNRMENGGTTSPSDIAWLEKRIHHLKDEMYMVESRLERMRYEHSLLKKKIKDLEHHK
ncbi:Protein VASCULAR ASSOCIATED DEATH 1, chloroplastic, partial [Mucuna pruriens]